MVEFERYADDGVIHCATEQQARRVLAALEERMAGVGLQLHPEKTGIVYCKDSNRRRKDCAETSFTFLGYTFRARQAPARQGGGAMFTAFLPGASKDALKRMSEEIHSWRIHLRSGTELEDIAAWINPVIRGWMTYYGRFYRTVLNPLLERINSYGCGSSEVSWLRCEDESVAVSGAVDAFVLAAEVEAPVVLEVAAGDQGAEFQDGLGAF